jgi:hypothetical protein
MFQEAADSEVDRDPLDRELVGVSLEADTGVLFGHALTMLTSWYT